MILKSGARISGMRPEIIFAAVVLDGIHRDLAEGMDIVITECTGGTHHPGSLHYVGLAIDIRTKDLTDAQKRAFYNKGRASLGEEFDLVEETDHAHCEYQPKTPINVPGAAPQGSPQPPTTT